MAVLYFRISSDWEQVVKLRDEIKKLENQLRNFGKSTPEQEVRKLETQLASTKQQMMGLVTEAAKAGAAMENDFKKKIYDASQVVNDFSTKITMQRGTIRQLQNELTTLKERYREVVKSNGDTSGMPEQIKALSLRLREQKDALFNLTQQQATARLSVKKLRDEYALFKQDGGDVKMTVDGISSSMRNWAATIAGGMGIKEFLGKIIQVRGEFENIETSLRVLLGGDTERLGSLLKEMKEYALISPLTTKDMASAMQMMIGFGIQAEDAMTYLKALGDISMGNTVHFNSLALAFSQMSAAGKLMGQDLNQMINAGFNPLQQISEKTGKSIGELKDEMSKGAISAQMVQQAFIDATSEGGKFYGMATEGAKTINGQISMLQESMDNMFNDMGQASQGAIVSAIQLTTKLVENYESVGKVLISMVAAYGTYKAALIANTALELARNKTLLTTIKNTRLAIAVQNVFNNVVKKHPFALIASLAIGAATAIYNFTKRTDKATEASAKLAANIKTETNELDDLFDSLKKAKEGTDERRTAIEDINSKYGSYLSNLLSEKSTVEDISEAYQEAKKSIIDYNVEKARTEYLQEPLERVTEYTESFYKTASKFSEELTNESQKGRFQAYLDKMVDDLKNGKTFNVDQIYDAFRAAQAKGNYSTVDDWLKAYRSGLENYGISDTEIISKVGGLDISDFKYSAGQLGIAFQSLSKASEEFKSFSKAYTETFDNSTKTEEPKKDLQTLGQLVEAIKKAEDNLKSLRSQSQQGLIETDKVKEAEEELAALTAKYKLMTDEQYGGTSQKQKKNDERKEKERLKAEQEFGRLLTDMEKQRWQSELELEEDGEKKRLEQIRADYENRKKQIQDGQKKLAEANKKNNLTGLNADGLTDEQAAKVAAANEANEKIRTNEEDIIRREKLQKEQEAYNEYLRLYGDYQDRRLAITKEYEQKIAEAGGEDTWHGKLLAKERDNIISELNFDKLKASINWELIFSDLSKVSKENLDKVKKQLREFKDSDEYKSMAVDQKQVVDEALDKINSTLIDNGGLLGDLPHQLDLLRQAQEELNKAQEEYNKALESGTDAEKEQAQGKLNAAQNKLDVQQGNVSKATDKTVRNFTVLSDAIIQLGSSSELSLSQIGGLAEGITNIFTESGSKIGGIIGTAISLLDAIGKQGLDGFIGNVFDSVFNAVHGIWDGLFGWTGIDFGGESIPDLAEKLENLTQSNEDLNTAIDNLSEKMEEASVSESTELYEQQKRNIEQMMANTQQQMVYSGSAYSNGFLGIGGDHSSNHEINDSMSADEWRAISNIVGRTIGSASDFWNLTSEEMYKVATQATTIYSKIKELADDGHANAAQFMDTYIQYWK